MQKRKTPKYAFHQIPGGGGKPRKICCNCTTKNKGFYLRKKNEMIPLVNEIFLDLTGI